LAYKREVIPLAARGTRHGTTDSDHLHALRLPHDIGTRLNHILWEFEATPPLPPRLYPPLYRHPGAKQYSASSTPLLDVRPRPEPG
jgi:hypothetical protein